jgi:hypothetical protein
VTEGDFLSKDNDPTWFTGGVIDNVNGVVGGVAGITIGQNTSVSGFGTFANFNFTAIGVGIHQLDLYDVIVANPGSQPYGGVHTQNGVVTVSSADSNITIEVLPSGGGTIYNHPYIKGDPLVLDYTIGETASFYCATNMSYIFTYWDLDGEVIGEYYIEVVSFTVTENNHTLKAHVQPTP